MNSYKILEIKDIIHETKSIKTFIFDWDMKELPIPKPGQFLMIWNFNGLGDELDEKPMSISKIDAENNLIAITVKLIGPFTKGLHKLFVGDKLGLRGPYGNGFRLKGEKILAIGGGVGMAPISAFVKMALASGKEVNVISASQTKDELLFSKNDDFLYVYDNNFDENELNKSENLNVYTCTDDGSCGFRGFATHRALDVLKYNDYDSAVVCGPEIMMKGIFDILENEAIPAQYSFERYMKCALGICGQCCVDKTGWRICVEGPVFDSSDVNQIIEFGKYHRNSSGAKEHY
ncbi:dihydroorotate dehydrogenase electron transfer subunit [Methanobrevibacter curvatus]|uniref:dihydroorotate dehydrogenase electron transfer subunit n=1 Tax=Methanobrevibacter curvatus TaxID=49547 RepID=UPI0008327F7E|nr:dihydroorotate dehydrogenase electron transfer subunit [Methanobrevibacter curvatus]